MRFVKNLYNNGGKTKMKRKTIFALLALMLVGIVAAAGSASAFGWHKGVSEEDREEIKQAVESNDFDAWKSLMMEKLTQDNFDKLVEHHENRAEHRENMEAVKAAIDSGDYDAYLEASDNLPEGHEVMSEDVFDIVVQMHQARQNGDHETAKELREQLGDDFPGPMGKGKGMQGKRGKGFGRARFDFGEE